QSQRERLSSWMIMIFSQQAQRRQSMNSSKRRTRMHCCMSAWCPIIVTAVLLLSREEANKVLLGDRHSTLHTALLLCDKEDHLRGGPYFGGLTREVDPGECRDSTGLGLCP